ncbi:alpha-2-macroglobulin family protein [Paracoccus contaminans]|uniref:Alpha-2-macroglobulin n=1 Tax=Paracoccus contaminans TaxID=1945662 RepID=A0A1W6CWQ5_9RHOB|nr:alpha-2-macroglobulin family protein [Paracoccus contaminans]ARJ69297.1 alpha-2-macroglobulin [Paracoccus contaminans]
MRLSDHLRAALACASLILSGAAALAQGAEDGVIPARRIVLDADTDLPGGDLAQVFNTTASACAALCLGNSDCTALTYNTKARSCFPKGSGAGEAQAFMGALSGHVLTPAPEAAGAEAGRLAAAAGWLTPADRRTAREQAESLGTLYPGTGEDVQALRDRAAEAGASGDAEAVMRWTGAAAALSDAPADWLSLAQALASAADADNGTEAQRRAAMAAAVNAYARDPGPAGEALMMWAAQAEKQGRGSAGLKALRQAAAADAQNGALAERVEAFAGRFGFRVEENRVDAEAPQPRACVVMSEDLAPGADYRSFVALPDRTLAVEAEGRQLCVSGVTHGQQVQITLRKGLPAASGEALDKDVPVSFYIRDRAPLARFAGRAYVLPAGGDQAVTLRSVNADKVALTLYRMSDRMIVDALRQDIFGQPLSGSNTDDFTGHMGVQVWKGEADIAPGAGGGPRKMNEETATRLDIGKAAGPLLPGVYALTAAIPGADAERSPATTQWFMISDLGLTSYSGTDGLTVAVRGLSDAAARPGVQVQLISRGNAVLATAATDADGIAHFDAGMTRGTDAAAPAMVTATAMKGDAVADTTFLSLGEPEFDLSDRGVEGQPPAPPIDIFATTDRGAYRAGETVHATILARDDRVHALDGLPLTAVISRPDGVEALRQLVPAAGDGGHVLDWPIPATAPRGTWRIDLRVEKDGPDLATLRVLVEDFRPERIDLALDLPPAPLPAGAPLTAGLAARWLYGAPGADLPVEGELRIAPAKAVPGWDGYRFGRHDAEDQASVTTLDAGTTDAEGRFTAAIPVPAALSGASQPMEATFVMSVREGAGRPVERRETRLAMPARPVIGIKPAFDGGAVAEGAEAGFGLIALGPDAKPVAARASWVLNKVTTDYQWFAIDGTWNWEPVTTRARVDGGEVQITADPASLSLPVQWGEYELVVRTAEGAESAVLFSAGWGAASAGSETPDRLRVTLDKPAYRAGETAQVRLEAAAEGTALVSVLSNRVIALRAVPVRAGANTIDLPVTDEWGAGVYVTVSAIRPVGRDAADAGHAPIRTLGLAYAAVDPGARKLDARIEAPAETTPRGEAKVRLTVAGAQAGQTVHATIAAVDQGILNLTAFRSPDPDGHYFGQRRLGVGLRDLYGRLILPSGAANGAIRSGGSDAGPQQAAPPPTEKLMAWFSGPVTLGADGAAEVTVPLPDFNGEVRLMAVAWTADAVGQAEAAMAVRDPVVMTVTAPAFLAPGDEAQVSLALAHVAGPAGAVGLTAESLPGEGPGAPTLGLAGLPAEVTVKDKARGTASLTITAPEAEGIAHLRLSAALPGGGPVVTKDLAITVERQDPSITRSTRLTLGPAQAQTVDPASLGDFRPGTGRAVLTSGAFAQFDLGAAVERLESYPYGCTEQLASGAMPQLYLAGLMPDAAPVDPAAPTRDVDQAIATILTRQTSAGGFGLWSAEDGDRWLDAYVTDFLSRARAAGHAVPDEAFRRALANLQNNLNAASDPQYADAADNAALAYAAYVLAREHAAVISDLRYYADTGAAAFATPMAAAQLGAALAAYGDTARADRLFRAAQERLKDAATGDDKGHVRADYGTALRDVAGTLALAAEAGSKAVDQTAAATTLSALIAARQAEGGALSTQEAVWAVLAGHALQAGPSALTIGGAPAAGGVTALGDPAAAGPVALQNTGSRPLDVTLSATAVPAAPAPAGGTAWTITRRYFTPDGTPADPAQLAQGTRLVAVIKVRGAGEGGGRLMVTDPLPAGFEIDNPSLVASGELAGLSWLDGLTETEMTEFRQDRFAAAVSRSDGQPFTLAYRLRAVAAGRFAHPAATVEDMYRPERRGWTDSGAVTITP